MTTNFALKNLPRIMTIGSVYEPVSRFFEGLPRQPAVEALPPLDCYLIHLALEFSPRRVLAVDLASDSTGGGSTITCLANPRVDRVVSMVGERSTTARDSSLNERIAEFAAEAGLPGAGRLSHSWPGELDCWEALALDPGRRGFPLVLIPSAESSDAGGRLFAAILKAVPEAVILVLGNGKLGSDRSTQGFVAALHALPEVRFWLLREHSPALVSSGVAVVAAVGNTIADDIVKRIEGVFTTNYDFLTLVRDSCLFALDQGVRGELASNGPRTSQFDSEDTADDPSSIVVQSSLRREIVRESLHRLQGQVRRLELELAAEQNRSLAQAVVRRSARRVVHFGRRHRQIFAPKGSMRERVARSMLQMGRGFLRS